MVYSRRKNVKTEEVAVEKMIKVKTNKIYIFWCILLSCGMPSLMSRVGEKINDEVKIGLVFDLKSKMGKMVESCIEMAVSDFYRFNPSYRTRLVFYTKDSDDVISAASGAVELLKNEEVRAILGPATTPEAKFVVELGAKAQVPIVSFSETSSSLSPLGSPYFIRMAASDSYQLKAIATLIEGFGWHEVVIVYEDTGYQDGFIRHLTSAIQGAGIRISFISAISISANESQILDELHKLKTISTRVFLVHMTSLLGSWIFVHAHTAGMMSEGYVWLTTDGLSNLLGSMDPVVIDAMQGVLGIRPYVSTSQNLIAFKKRWETELQCTKPKTELNIFGLWAYDAVWALAKAVESIGPINSGFVKVRKHQNASDMANLGSSEVGPILLNEILNTRFKGLSGKFNLVNGQLQIEAFEILHVIGKGERPIGYWTPNRGLSRYPNSTSEISNYSTSVSVLRNIIWPGDSTIKPMYLAVPRRRLKVGVPVTGGFTEFLKLEQFLNTDEYNITGFCADVFREVLLHVPFKIENPQYIPFVDPITGKSAGTYDDLLKNLEEKTFDMVVGDVTILAERAQRVEFSIPYLDSEVVMLRQVKNDKGRDMWIFLKPLSLNLWLTIGIACIITGLIIRTLEHRVNSSAHLGMLISSPVAALFFPERNIVNSNWSRLVMVVWLFTTFVLMQSYTANLASMLTVSRLHPSSDKLSCIGYRNGSFVKDILAKRLDYNESKIKSYTTVEQYHDALSKGCNDGGVDAIFDELPFIKIFLDTYGEANYVLEGSSYKTGGLGFAFPRGSALTPHISTALLNLTVSGEMHAIVDKNLGPDFSDRDYFFGAASYNDSIQFQSFTGLFILSGTITILALLFSTPWFQRKISFTYKHYIKPYVYPSASSVKTISDGDLSATVVHDSVDRTPTESEESD